MGRKDECNNVRERIQAIRDHFKWTENSLAGDSATQKRLNRQLSHGGTITLDTILLILNACPAVSAEWLLLGHGEMLRTEEAPVPCSHHSRTKDDDPSVIRHLMSLLQEKDRQIDRLITLLSGE